jgi:RimJ/RimL family protein N-acetyltransferase
MNEISQISLRDSLPETIATARLRMAAPVMADLAELVPLANNDNVTRWTARMPFPYGQEDGVEFIETFATAPTERPYAIRNEAGAFIGIVSLMFDEDEPPEIGYWLGEPFWGQGYGGEAAAGLIGAARASGRFDVIGAKVIAGNAASLRILDKVGFVRAGEDIGDCGRNKGKRIVHLKLELVP